jgi:hypothetical protein
MTYTEEFMANCLANKIVNLQDICQVAQTKISELQKNIIKLKEQQKSEEVKENELRLLIKQLSTNKSVKIKLDHNFDNLEPDIQKIIVEILPMLDYGSITSAMLIEKWSIKEQNVIYAALKWLWDRDIIQRNADKSFVQGNKWAEKPQMKLDINKL